MSRTLVLASSSRYRRSLLERLGMPFITDAPDIDERVQTGETPDALVARLARCKAEHVAKRHPHALVIGSDQVAVYDGEVAGKPGSHEQAVRQLQRISGKKALLKTGLALIDTDSGRTQVDVVDFSIVFRTLSHDLIERYLRREQPYDCAGAVKSEGLGVVLFERFEGEDPTALIGLPLIRLVHMLESEAFPVL